MIIEGISHEDKIGHLFVVDLIFDFERARCYFSMKFTQQSLKRKKFYRHPRGPFFNF